MIRMSHLPPLRHEQLQHDDVCNILGAHTHTRPSTSLVPFFKLKLTVYDVTLCKLMFPVRAAVSSSIVQQIWRQVPLHSCGVSTGELL